MNDNGTHDNGTHDNGTHDNDPHGSPLPGRRAVLGTAALGLAASAAAFSGIASAASPGNGPSGSAEAPAAEARTGGGRRFTGRSVLITGATSGIGRATALAFAAEGARVGFCGRRAALGRQVEREIRDAGGEAVYVPVDVREAEEVRRFVDRVASRYGSLDIAVNNAGIGFDRPLHEMSVEEWDDVQHTNARGVFLALKYEVPHMLRSGGGVILCTGSSAAEQARPGGAAYTASKRAVQGLVKSAALAYGPRGIRVNAVLPGTTDTALVRPPGIPDADWARYKKAFGPLNIDGLERMAEPDEIARSLLALASDDFPYMTGASIAVDGGATAGRKMVRPAMGEGSRERQPGVTYRPPGSDLRRPGAPYRPSASTRSSASPAGFSGSSERTVTRTLRAVSPDR